jgi:methyl-accepting chemotaxis protein
MPAATTVRKKPSKSTKNGSVELQSQVDAISRSQAVVEFSLDGTILTANDNFLAALGYTLEQIKGQHQRIFCDTEYVNSPAYQAFWNKLNRGEFEAGEFKLIGKGGEDTWFQASYNPILDKRGMPVKIVTFATDITQQVQERCEVVKLRQVVDESESAFMMVDRDFVVT